MGDEAEAQTRKERMLPYQVNAALMQAAKADAYFMHCLPAHAGEEVTQAVLDSPQSIIFDEAENRLHTQKAILAKLAELNANSSSATDRSGPSDTESAQKSHPLHPKFLARGYTRPRLDWAPTARGNSPRQWSRRHSRAACSTPRPVLRV